MHASCSWTAKVYLLHFCCICWKGREEFAAIFHSEVELQLLWLSPTSFHLSLSLVLEWLIIVSWCFVLNCISKETSCYHCNLKIWNVFKFYGQKKYLAPLAAVNSWLCCAVYLFIWKPKYITVSRERLEMPSFWLTRASCSALIFFLILIFFKPNTGGILQNSSVKTCSLV